MKQVSPGKNAPGCNAVSVAQYVLASLITIALRRGETLQGKKTIGIVGVGHVGERTGKNCVRLTVYISCVMTRHEQKKRGAAGFVSLDTIAEEADIITFHTPLTKEGPFATRHLANEVFSTKHEKKPWFVNASRGAVHDTTALIKALKSGKISEAVIDCWENEPAIDRGTVKSYSRCHSPILPDSPLMAKPTGLVPAWKISNVSSV